MSLEPPMLHISAGSASRTLGPTLPLSGRQGLYIESIESMEACPLEGLVIRSSMP